MNDSGGIGIGTATASAPSTKRNHKRRARVNLLRKILLFMQGAWIVGAGILWVSSSGAVGILSATILLLLVPIFVYGYVQISELVKSSLTSMAKSKDVQKSRASPVFSTRGLITTATSAEETKLMVVFLAIRRTALGSILTAVFTSTSSFVYGIVGLTNGGWKYYSPEGSLSPYMLTSEFLALGILGFNFVIYGYLRTSFTKFNTFTHNKEKQDAELANRNNTTQDEPPNVDVALPVPAIRTLNTNDL